MKKFNELYSKIILEESQALNKTKAKSLIKKALTGNYRSIKALGNGYSFEILTMTPMSKKYPNDEVEYSHDSKTSSYSVTFDLSDDKLNLTVKRTDRTDKDEKTKSFKVVDDLDKLQNDVEKFIGKSTSSLH